MKMTNIDTTSFEFKTIEAYCKNMLVVQQEPLSWIV